MKNEDIYIVPTREEHIEACVEISIRAYELIHEEYRKLLGSELHDNVMGKWRERKGTSIFADQSSGRGFVALKGECVVGFVSYWMEGETGHIGNNAVDPDYRGRGIAGLLYNRVLDEMRKHGAKYACVTTGGDNGHAAARRAYQKVGFLAYLPSVTYYQKL